MKRTQGQEPEGTAEIDCAIAGLQRLTELFAERRRQLAREAELSETQWRVLEEIAGERFMPSMFARRRACTPAAVSRTLRQLLESDLVRVSVAEEDGRQRVYRLTPRGRRTLARLRESRGRAIAAVWEDLPRQDLRAFVRFSDVLAERLERYVEARER